MRMPPVNALRAFEAAARHCSFKRAGEELNVSPGAVSRFVKLLEEDLGVELFERRPNGLRLTETGQSLRPRLTKAFSELEDAVTLTSQRPNEVKLLLPETLGLRLLLKKVSAYNDSGQGPMIRCSIEFKGWDSFFENGFDLGVCCALAPEHRPDNLDFQFLRSEALTPMCAPSLLEGSQSLKRSEDLKGFELLHPYTDRMDWKKWLEANGAEGVDWASGQTFLSMEFAVRAAVQGLGVVLGDLTLLEDELERGELVTPLDFVLTQNTGYLIFASQEKLKTPEVATVYEWLLDVAGSA